MVAKSIAGIRGKAASVVSIRKTPVRADSVYIVQYAIDPGRAASETKPKRSAAAKRPKERTSVNPQKEQKIQSCERGPFCLN